MGKQYFQYIYSQQHFHNCPVFSSVKCHFIQLISKTVDSLCVIISDETFPLSSRLSVVGGGTQACSGEGSARGHRSVNKSKRWYVFLWKNSLERSQGVLSGGSQRLIRNDRFIPDGCRALSNSCPFWTSCDRGAAGL